MTRNTKIFIFAMISIILSAIIFYFSSLKEQEFKSVSWNSSNYIYNSTPYPFLDTVIGVGLDELNLTNKFVVIREIDYRIVDAFYENTNRTLNAFIVGNEDQFIIYISDMNRNKSITVLSHELIHIKQYSNKTLQLYPEHIIWMDDIIPLEEIDETPYDDRPWEKEAFDEQVGLANKLRKVLY